MPRYTVHSKSFRTLAIKIETVARSLWNFGELLLHISTFYRVQTKFQVDRIICICATTWRLRVYLYICATSHFSNIKNDFKKSFTCSSVGDFRFSTRMMARIRRSQLALRFCCLPSNLVLPFGRFSSSSPCLFILHGAATSTRALPVPHNAVHSDEIHTLHSTLTQTQVTR